MLVRVQNPEPAADTSKQAKPLLPVEFIAIKEKKPARSSADQGPVYLSQIVDDDWLDATVRSATTPFAYHKREWFSWVVHEISL